MEIPDLDWDLIGRTAGQGFGNFLPWPAGVCAAWSILAVTPTPSWVALKIRPLRENAEGYALYRMDALEESWRHNGQNMPDRVRSSYLVANAQIKTLGISLVITIAFTVTSGLLLGALFSGSIGSDSGIPMQAARVGKWAGILVLYFLTFSIMQRHVKRYGLDNAKISLAEAINVCRWNDEGRAAALESVARIDACIESFRSGMSSVPRVSKTRKRYVASHANAAAARLLDLTTQALGLREGRFAQLTPRLIQALDRLCNDQYVDLVDQSPDPKEGSVESVRSRLKVMALLILGLIMAALSWIALHAAGVPDSLGAPFVGVILVMPLYLFMGSRFGLTSLGILDRVQESSIDSTPRR